MIYDPNRNFYKYRLSKFSQISSIESKFDTLKMFYRDFTSLKFLKAKKERVNHQFTVLNDASNLYNNEGYKTIVRGKNYNLKGTKTFLLEITKKLPKTKHANCIIIW